MLFLQISALAAHADTYDLCFVIESYTFWLNGCYFFFNKWEDLVLVLKETGNKNKGHNGNLREVNMNAEI